MSATGGGSSPPIARNKPSWPQKLAALEKGAEQTTDYSEKQHFLNKVYERFFQGFSAKEADTHGIVYTPQPIVDFMVRSVEEILRYARCRGLRGCFRCHPELSLD